MSWWTLLCFTYQMNEKEEKICQTKMTDSSWPSYLVNNNDRNPSFDLTLWVHKGPKHFDKLKEQTEAQL